MTFINRKIIVLRVFDAHCRSTPYTIISKKTFQLIAEQ